jgi:hypothetical protein
MKYVWRSLNTGLIASCALGGYFLVGDNTQHHPLQDWFACPMLAILAFVFALFSVWYSTEFAKCAILKSPSWDRLSMDWRNDPLQCLAVSTCNLAAFSLGGLVRLPFQAHPQYLAVGMFCSGMLGFLLGQALIYRVYRSRICSAISDSP